MTNKMGGPCRTSKFTEDNHSRLNTNHGILSANILSNCYTKCGPQLELKLLLLSFSIFQ